MVHNNSQLSSHRHVLLPPCRRELLQLYTLLKNQAMRRPSKVKHAQLLPLCDVLPFSHRDVTRAHLVHADTNKGQQPNSWIVRLEHNNGPRCHGRQVALRHGDAMSVNLRNAVLLVQGLKEGLGKVRSVLDKRPLHGARNGRVPAVVGQGREKRLVHGAAGELGREGVVGEHVDHGIALALGKEGIAELDVGLKVERSGLAGVGNDVVVVRAGDGTGGVMNLASKEVLISTH